MVRSINLYNTLTRTQEKFVPNKNNKVGMYTCGPTVFEQIPLENYRPYILTDVLRRVLENSGANVKSVMNVTDIEYSERNGTDHGEKREPSLDERNPWKIADDYEIIFENISQKMNISPPDKLCRASRHIEDMIDFVKALKKEGYAYVIDGNVYFDTSKFAKYAELAKLNMDHTQSRVKADPRKRNPHDFVLWFSGAEHPHQIMKWPSPWGEGFPGWHIECSTMASKYLGPHIDIHIGRSDHIPVHHTNEIAQSEARFKHQWVKYWLHTGPLVIDKDKMHDVTSDGLTLDSVLKLEDGLDPLHVRYLFLTTHYRTHLNFSPESLAAAKKAFEKLENKLASWSGMKVEPLTKSEKLIVDGYKDQIWDALTDDLNTPVAVSIIRKSLHNENLSDNAKRDLLEFIDPLLGIGLTKRQKPELALTENQQRLFEEWNAAKAEKNWATADKLRTVLKEQGIDINKRPIRTNQNVGAKAFVPGGGTP